LSLKRLPCGSVSYISPTLEQLHFSLKLLEIKLCGKPKKKKSNNGEDRYGLTMKRKENVFKRVKEANKPGRNTFISAHPKEGQAGQIQRKFLLFLKVT